MSSKDAVMEALQALRSEFTLKLEGQQPHFEKLHEQMDEQRVTLDEHQIALDQLGRQLSVLQDVCREQRAYELAEAAQAAANLPDQNWNQDVAQGG
jgi:septal ring factor EnvC (AmiA/AmiB activator)